MTLTLDPAPGFTGSRLDRADHLRADEAGLAAMRGDPKARLLRLNGLDPVLGDDPESLDWGSLAEAPDDAELAFLGFLEGTPRFVALAEQGRRDAGFSPAVRHVIDAFPAEEAATYAAARSLVDWHARHRFCARCGAATTAFRAGWARRCDDCRAEHFPRTDPVVIMLAEHDGRILVGRQPRFPAGRYSALAGFVEVGESLEEAVARELFEEAGVRATSVRYVASQPWPFPSSLMVACVAQVDDDRITLDTNELEDAMWVTRDELGKVLSEAEDAAFLCPPPYAIAYTLLLSWFNATGPAFDAPQPTARARAWG